MAAAEGISLAEIGMSQLISQNVATELIERSATTKYPALFLYCDRVTNLLTEKFRTFSGKVRMVVEVRVSQDRLEGLERQVQLYVDAVTNVLDGHRGDWGEGMFYPGGYEVQFGAIKHGGRNLLQVAKVVFEVHMSVA